MNLYHSRVIEITTKSHGWQFAKVVEADKNGVPYYDNDLVGYWFPKQNFQLTNQKLMALIRPFSLVVVVGADAMNTRLLSTLWTIEVYKTSVYQHGNMRVEIVGDVGSDSFVGTRRYHTVGYGIASIFKIISEQVKHEDKAHLAEIFGKMQSIGSLKMVPSINDILIKGALKKALKEHYEQYK